MAREISGLLRKLVDLMKIRALRPSTDVFPGLLRPWGQWSATYTTYAI